eukprot:g3711.t1
MSYEGEVHAGLPHGRGTLRYGDGDADDSDDEGTVFRGRFQAGAKHGRGTLSMAGGGAVVSGVWRNDVLEGRARCSFADGRVQECFLRRGHCVGVGVQLGASGELLYRGAFRDWTAHGRGCMWLRGEAKHESEGAELAAADGALRGRWVDGALDGAGCEFFYPDGSRLLGTWRAGEMRAARSVPGEGGARDEGAALLRDGADRGPAASSVKGATEDDDAAGRDPRAARRKRRRLCSGSGAEGGGAAEGCSDAGAVGERAGAGAVVRFDPSTEARISRQPLLHDPYERRTVFVARSRMPGAGEGLFARCALPAGRIVSWYNGVKVPCTEVDGRSDWALNDNVINLDADTAIDVPPECSSTAQYCASLGHKANHAAPGTNNAEYDDCFHPRFGDIKCVRLVRGVAAGDEITVDYMFLDETPDWYDPARHGLTVAEQRRQAERSERARAHARECRR